MFLVVLSHSHRFLLYTHLFVIIPMCCVRPSYGGPSSRRTTTQWIKCVYTVSASLAVSKHLNLTSLASFVVWFFSDDCLRPRLARFTNNTHTQKKTPNAHTHTHSVIKSAEKKCVCDYVDHRCLWCSMVCNYDRDICVSDSARVKGDRGGGKTKGVDFRVYLHHRLLWQWCGDDGSIITMGVWRTGWTNDCRKWV